MKLNRCLLIPVLTAGLSLTSSRASAAIYYSVITDTPSRLELQIGDVNLPLPGTTNYGIFPPIANWAVPMTTARIVMGGSFADDKLTLIGGVRHLIAPHGEGPGALFNFQFADLTNGGLASGSSMIYGPQGGTQPHATHDDIVTVHVSVLSSGVGVGGGEMISSWFMTIDARHTPAPGTAAVLLLGAAVVGRRRR